MKGGIGVISILRIFIAIYPNTHEHSTSDRIRLSRLLPWSETLNRRSIHCWWEDKQMTRCISEPKSPCRLTRATIGLAVALAGFVSDAAYADEDGISYW